MPFPLTSDNHPPPGEGDGLNRRQSEAVAFDGGNLLIVAGPGTGKTHTLVARVIRLAGKVSPSQKVLAITFTNKAADEMRGRLEAGLAGREERVQVGTFHAFALKLLRDHRARLPFPLDFTIATPDDIEAMAAEFLPGISKKERRDLLRKVSAWKATLEAEAADPGINAFRSFLREQRLVDFDDILRDAVLLLRDNADIAQEVRVRYPFVCVDEYQDVNAVQVELLKLLAGNGVGRPDRGRHSAAPSLRSPRGGVGLTVIGDPDQAIYGFRGSDALFFRDFESTFAPCARVELAENYRSAGNLLQASGQVIRAQKVSRRTFSVPELVARIHQKGRLTVHAAASEKTEAIYVAGEIERLIGGVGHHSHDTRRVKAGETEGGHSFADIAVVFRLNAQAKAFEAVFSERGIPFQVAGVRPAGLGLASRRALRGLDSRAGLLPELERLRALDPVLDADWERVAAFAGQAGSVEEFLDRLSLETPEDVYVARAEKVALLTLHAAKGLEFPVVFMAGCEDGLLPLDVDFLDTRPDEERRLFYVGMTRAKERLYFVRALKRRLFGSPLRLPASPYLGDIRVELETSLPLEISRRRQQANDQMKLF